MLDRIEAGGQPYAVFSFPKKQQGGTEVLVKDSAGQTLLSAVPENDFTSLIVSAPILTEGTYTLWCDGVQLSVMSGGMGGGMMRPDGGMMEKPEGMEPPEGIDPPEGMEKPEGMEPPEGGHGGMGATVIGEAATEFTIKNDGNLFTITQ